MENAKISAWQMFVITFFFTLGDAWIVLPGQLIHDSKQYAWLVFLWALLYGIALSLVWLYLSKYHPNKSLIEIAEQTLGKWAGGIVALFYILYFIQLSSWLTNTLSEFMHICLMPLTPLSIFNVMLLLVCAYAVVMGIESIAMVAEFLIPYIFIVFWIPVFVGLRTWDWHNFNIAFDFDLWAAIVQTKYALAFPFMETISLFMLFPFVKHRVKTAYLMGLSLAGLFLSITVLIIIGILGVNRSSHLIFPMFAIFREMQFTGFLEHMEAILAVNILFIVCIKLSVLFYCAVLSICQLFKIKRRSVVAYPLIWVLSAYSLLFKNVIENIEWIDKYLFSYYTLYAIVFPVLLIVGTWLQQKKHIYKGSSPL